jgi:magnesium transporter
MRVRSVIVETGKQPRLDADTEPSGRWLDDARIRWLNVEDASPEDLARLGQHLGPEGPLLADHISGDHWFEVLDREQSYVGFLASPTAWLEHERWFHIVLLPETIVTLHSAEIPETDDFLQRRWFDRPGPEATIDAVMLHVIQGFVEEEVAEFYRVRFQVTQHAEGLRQDDEAYTVEGVEELMTRCHHMGVAFFELQTLLQGIGFIRSRAFALGPGSAERYGQAVQGIAVLRQGVEQMQHRLSELQQQHLMDKQSEFDSRVRLLTIISAIFLPLTLIAGIYGMNFEYMPELSERNAYYVALAAMFGVAGGMLGFFYWKGWFR